MKRAPDGKQTLWIVVAVALGAAAPAFATNFGSINSGPDVGWLTNNYVVNVIQRDLSATYTTGLEDAVDDYNTVSDPNWDVATWAASSCTSGLIDVCVYDDNFQNNGLYAYTECIG